jgi:soluble cytochrome b562
MKTRLLFVLPILALAALLGLQAQEKKDQSELGAKMDNMRKSFSSLNKQSDDATKNEDSLAKLATIRQNAEASLKLEPPYKAQVPADQQAKYMADYQAKMKELIAEIGKAEAAFKANNNADAKAALAKMGAIQKQGHKAFPEGFKAPKKTTN